MGIAKFLSNIGLTKKAADESAVDPVVEQKDSAEKTLIEQKDDLEKQKEKINEQIAQVDANMSIQHTNKNQSQINEEITNMDPKDIDQNEVAKPTEEVTKAVEPAVKPVVKPAAEENAPLNMESAKKGDDKKKKEKEKKEKEEKAKKEKEDKAKKKSSFNLRFVQGKTFTDSYFVAEKAGEFRAVKASRIIPLPVQTKILKTLAATGKPPEDVVTPTDIVEQLTSQGVDSLETFEEAAAVLEADASVMAKKAGMMAWNEQEIQSPRVKAGDAPISAVQSSEVEAGKRFHPVNRPISSKTKQYYGRLPSAAGGETTNALNPQSNFKDKIEFMRKALEEMKVDKEVAEDKAFKAENEKNKMIGDKESSDTSDLIESIVKDLTGKKLLDSKSEQEAIGLLSKIDRKSLPSIAPLFKLLGKAEKADKIDSPALGSEDKAPMFGGEKPPKTSAARVFPSFLPENEPDTVSGAGMLAKYWDAK